MNKIFLALLIVLCYFSHLNADSIDFTKNSDAVLKGSELLRDKDNLSITQVKQSENFIKSKSSQINLGFVRNEVLWIRLTLENNSSKNLIKILEVKNPLLEEVFLYEELNEYKKEKFHLNSSFEIELSAKDSKTYYIKIINTTTSMRAGIILKDKDTFLHDENVQLSLVILFFGIIIALFIYYLILFFYTKEYSYLYYSVYIFALIAQQATYLGVSQLFLPSWFLYYDNLGVLFKVNILYIAAGVYAKSFLQTKNNKWINKVYNVLIVVAIIEMPLFGTPWFYYPEVGIFTGLIFVLFNVFAGYYVYAKGHKQARFFVISWSMLAVGFILMILDGLGLISVMYRYSNIIMYLTAFEALLLALAFTDKYTILREEKEKADNLLLKSYESRQKVIEDEIKKQTMSLHTALHNQETLLKELQHRTKNNLQLILSIVRMESDCCSEAVKEKFKSLESRIEAIAKINQLLYIQDDLEQISMSEYINELCDDLEFGSDKKINIDIKIKDIYMPLKDASYVGLIINELVTNSIKHAKVLEIRVKIEMYEENEKYMLVVEDNGDGYEPTKGSGMGLNLVHTLVEKQLEGILNIDSKNRCKCKIEFEL